MFGHEVDRIGHGTVDELDDPLSRRGPEVGPRSGSLTPAAERQAQDRDLEVLAGVVSILGHANGRGLERGHPLQLVDPLDDMPPVGRGRCTVFEQQGLGHPPIDPRSGGQVEGGEQANGIHRSPVCRASASFALPAAVRRYFWRLLVGFSGMVISISPFSRAGSR